MSVLGTSDFTLVDRKRTYAPEAGYGWVYIYQGALTGADAFFAQKAAELTTDALDMSKSDGLATVSVTVYDDDGEGNPASTTDNETWEVVGQIHFRDLINFSGRPEDADTPDFTSNAYVEGTGDIFIQDEMAKVRKAVENADDTYNSSYLTTTPLFQYNGLLRRGVVEYQKSAILLRRTIQAGRRTLLKAAWEGVDRAWTLDGGAGSPNLSGSTQAALIGALEDHPDFDATKKQWLKLAPQILSIGRGKYNIVYEWQFAKEWSWSLYNGDGIDATNSNAPTLL